MLDPSPGEIIEPDLLRLEKLHDAIIVVHQVRQRSVIFFTEILGVAKVHGDADVGVASVSDLSPARIAFAAEDGVIVVVERLESDLEQLGQVAVVSDASDDGRRLVVAPPVIAGFDGGPLHFQAVGAREWGTITRALVIRQQEIRTRSKEERK